ncbi:uncharacterized protein [Solanum tuberosum]|uniref:ZC3H15/TMA46 family C-terminal domain-containing protein n=1 Tax=Solanum tuberosum TaxID=4113 RepID=M1AG28_SOLTU|nr:PREDICTED: uncharacterized protein LOC102587214 [Solanum tuberosum]
MGEEAKDDQPESIQNPNSNRITQTQFLSWKRQKDVDALARKAEVARKRAEDVAAGAVQMNGRELFLHEPWVFDNSLY